ncbi:unnamed protein product, partial [Cuscuta epithymum]
MVSVYNLYSANTRIQVNNGCSLFWDSNWSPFGPLYRLSHEPHDPITIREAYENIHSHVGDLPHHVSTALINNSPSFEETPDTTHWTRAPNGDFSFKTAYDEIRKK